MKGKDKKKNRIVLWVVCFACIAVLAVACAAAITEGFTTADPYGWFTKAEEPAGEADGEEPTAEGTAFVWYEYEGEEDPAPVSPMFCCVFKGEIDRSKMYAFTVEIETPEGMTEQHVFTLKGAEDFGEYAFTAELKSDTVSGWGIILIGNADIDMSNAMGIKETEGVNILSIGGTKESVAQILKSATLIDFSEIE